VHRPGTYVGIHHTFNERHRGTGDAPRAHIERHAEQHSIQSVDEMSRRQVPRVASALDQHDSLT
jgi:hypothetical protein